MRAVRVALVMVATVAACGGNTIYPECIGAVRYADTTYREVGFTDHEGTALEGSAAFASCRTVSRDGASKALRDESEPITARSLPGYRSEDVVAVQVTDSAWSVLVSENASQRLLHQIRESGLLNAGKQ